MKEIIGNADNTFTFDATYNNVFCYGKEVDDFHTVDKQKLFAVNFSATQEIDKIQQEEKTKLAAAEERISALETENASLKASKDPKSRSIAEAKSPSGEPPPFGDITSQNMQ